MERRGDANGNTHVPLEQPPSAMSDSAHTVHPGRFVHSELGGVAPSAQHRISLIVSSATHVFATSASPAHALELCPLPHSTMWHVVPGHVVDIELTPHSDSLLGSMTVVLVCVGLNHSWNDGEFPGL